MVQIKCFSVFACRFSITPSWVSRGNELRVSWDWASLVPFSQSWIKYELSFFMGLGCVYCMYGMCVFSLMQVREFTFYNCESGRLVLHSTVFGTSCMFYWQYNQWFLFWWQYNKFHSDITQFSELCLIYCYYKIANKCK